MNQKTAIIAIVLALVLAFAVGVFLTQKAEPQESENLAYQQDLGMYPYACDNGSRFILSPLEGLQVVQVSADAQGMFTGTASLTLAEGTRYIGTAPDGQQVEIVGDGETIHLTTTSAHALCTPMPNPDMAPWNWGDV